MVKAGYQGKKDRGLEGFYGIGGSHIQRREKCPSHEEKAPSRSGFSVSMHVVLKTRHANPNIHVRRY